MIIDNWMIPATPHTIGRWGADPRYSHGFRSVFGIDAFPVRTSEQMVAEMDAAQIDRAVLTCMADDRGEIASADDVLSMCQAYPGRFVGSYCFDPLQISSSLARLEELLTGGHFGAALALPWAFGLAPNDPRWYPLYAAAERAGIPVTVQVGHTAPYFRSALGRPMDVEDVVYAFPELRIVLGHLGWPWVDEVIALVGKYPHVYVDTSAHSPSRIPPALLEFMRTSKGATKVLFGSDYPALDLDRLVRSARRLDLPADVLHRYLGANAAALYSWSN